MAPPFQSNVPIVLTPTAANSLLRVLEDNMPLPPKLHAIHQFMITQTHSKLHMCRTPRSGGISTVQLRSKLPHIMRTIPFHTNYRRLPGILSSWASCPLRESSCPTQGAFLRYRSWILVDLAYKSSYRAENKMWKSTRLKGWISSGIQGIHMCVVPVHTSATHWQVIVKFA
jgi:hypothetical protein